MASVVCQFEYFTMNSEASLKKTEAIKYMINEAELPINVKMHSALRKLERVV